MREMREPKPKLKKPVAKPVVKKQRVAVFIDGSNLYFKLKTLIPHKTDLIHYRYADLIKSFLEPNQKITYMGYYIGVIRDTKKTKDHSKTQDLIKNQQKVFEQLRHQKINIIRGYLLERDAKYFEKGVDVRLAIDIVAGAFDKSYDVAFVLSSDTDMIPAIQKAIGYKREVVYVGFEHQPSLALIRHANKSKLITVKEAERFQAKPLKIKRFDVQ